MTLVMRCGVCVSNVFREPQQIILSLFTCLPAQVVLIWDLLVCKVFVGAELDEMMLQK